VDLPGLNTDDQEAQPSISPDGRYIAFQSDRGGGEMDVYVYDRQAGALIPTPGLNSSAYDGNPNIR
jgi:Tol biopolymer transport system component